MSGFCDLDEENENGLIVKAGAMGLMTKQTTMIGAPVPVQQKRQTQILSKDTLVLAAIAVVSVAFATGLYKQLGLGPVLSLTIGALGFFILFSLHYIIVQVSASDSLVPRMTSLERVVARLSRELGQYESLSKDMAHFKETCARIDALQSQLELGGLGDALQSRDDVAQRLSQEIGRLEAQIAKMKVEFDRVNKTSRGKLTSELEGIETFVKGMGDRYLLDAPLHLHQLASPSASGQGHALFSSNSGSQASSGSLSVAQQVFGSHMNQGGQSGLFSSAPQTHSNTFQSSAAQSGSSGLQASGLNSGGVPAGGSNPSSASGSLFAPMTSTLRAPFSQQSSSAASQSSLSLQNAFPLPSHMTLPSQSVAQPSFMQVSQTLPSHTLPSQALQPQAMSHGVNFVHASALAQNQMQPQMQPSQMQPSQIQNGHMQAAHMQSGQMPQPAPQKRMAQKPNLPRNLMPRPLMQTAQTPENSAYGEFHSASQAEKSSDEFDFSFDVRSEADRGMQSDKTSFEKKSGFSNYYTDVSLSGFERQQEEALDSQMRDIIRAALEANRIDLHLQPVVSLPDRNVIYYEALTRLRGIAGELIYPASFLAIAEREGYMSLIDNVMIFRSSQVLKKLASRGSARGIFCNISQTSLLDPEFFPDFITFMEQNKELAENLFFDFNQSLLQTGGPIEAESLSALARLGYRFALDKVNNLDIDFAALQKQGFQYIKVDADTMLNGMEQAKSRIHAADLRSYLKRFGLELIVPGIETENMFARLAAFNVGLGQGNLFSEPRPVRPEVFSDNSPQKAA